MTWQKLKDIFKVVGRVVDVEILEERKGAAIVQLSTADEAVKAIGELLRLLSVMIVVMCCSISLSFVPWSDAYGSPHATENGEACTYTVLSPKYAHILYITQFLHYNCYSSRVTV